MVKVSVVIPVYNVEDYLEECLDSIINQTLDDIEIICINDGSTDSSLNILEKYANLDGRIIIHSQENSGLSASRNRGIDLSNGDYIYFIDSDDTLELNALSELYEFSNSNNLDLLIFKVINFYDGSGKKFTSKYYEMSFMKKFNKKIFDYNDIGEKAFKMSVSAPGKLYKKDLLDSIRFEEGLIFEDNLFFAEVMIKAKRVSFLNKHYYNRRIRENSITTTRTLKFADSFVIVNKIIELFKRENLYEDYKKPLIENKIYAAHNRLSLVDEEYKEEFFQILKKDFSNFKDDFENDDVFKNEIRDFFRYWFRVAFTARNYRDYLLKCDLYHNQYKVKYYKDQQKELKKELKYYADRNNEILSSKSWKVTKPLRKLGGNSNG